MVPMMDGSKAMPFALLLLAFLLLFSSLSTVTCLYPPHNSIPSNHKAGELQTYIIHVLPPKHVTVASTGDLEAWYRSFLPKATPNSGGGSRLIFAYSEVFSGFAARLTEAEVEDMAKKPGFVRAFPERLIPLATTYTPRFLGLQQGRGLWKSSNLGKGVIIGLLDTGIIPTHPSFSDDGLPSPPSRWNGTCEFKSCNNKIIGARSFLSNSSNGPVDMAGHGSHTASTAAGNFVKNANVLGQATGTAAGVAPRAHLAIYQVCDERGCTVSAILAGLDAAVKDGVDVLSLSLGGDPLPFYEDPIAIGTFAAIEKGIVVSCAAGNSGPDDHSVSNAAPWILTVGASTIDRSFKATVKLGNGQELDGESLYQPDHFTSKQLPLVLPRFDCSSSIGMDAKGKVVALCGGWADKSAMSEGVKFKGGAAVIIYNNAFLNNTILAGTVHALPASEVSYDDGINIRLYYMGKEATATIVFNGTSFGTSPAPAVAAFSSRGPNSASPQILKPDITGPGVNILGAWHVPTGQEAEGDAHFSIISGTSMATPHLSGVAALIKSVHPDWSPAAIKSGIITTADENDNTRKPIKDQRLQTASFFAKGAGHVNPSKAVDPGLVFDLEVDDYVGYLCVMYKEEYVRLIAQRSISCSDYKNITQSELNYPSITVKSGRVTVNRTVTNVGPANATYRIEADLSDHVRVTVKPDTLKFSKANEKKTFSVTVSGDSASEGNLKLVSDTHVVRIPIVVRLPRSAPSPVDNALFLS